MCKTRLLETPTVEARLGMELRDETLFEFIFILQIKTILLFSQEKKNKKQKKSIFFKTRNGFIYLGNRKLESINHSRGAGEFLLRWNILEVTSVGSRIISSYTIYLSTQW